jgi:hypothetical protein
VRSVPGSSRTAFETFTSSDAQLSSAWLCASTSVLSSRSRVASSVTDDP